MRSVMLQINEYDDDDDDKILTFRNLLEMMSIAVKCNRTQGDAVPAPANYGSKRFPTSDYLHTYIHTYIIKI